MVRDNTAKEVLLKHAEHCTNIIASGLGARGVPLSISDKLLVMHAIIECAQASESMEVRAYEGYGNE